MPSPNDDFLAKMQRSSRERLAAARERTSQAALERSIADLPPAPRLGLSAEGFDLIAEIKRRSPAVGALTAGVSTEQIGERACVYAAGGAAAVSVLTEPSRFDGELSHLSAAVRALAKPAVPGASVPVMRKDFLVDPYQVYEARAAGAGGVLLILRMLPASTQRAMLEACAALGMFALLEAFDEADLVLAAERVVEQGAKATLLVGVNSRDLSSLAVVPERLERLAEQLPRGVPAVAESGVAGAHDAARLARAGYRLALVGTALMRSVAPHALIGELLVAGRAAARNPQASPCGSRSAE
jgi:indole-3-glycerol phosphate synthase